MFPNFTSETDILQDDVNQTSTNPVTGGGGVTTSPFDLTEWGKLAKDIGGIFTGKTGGPLGQLAAFGGVAALLNQLAGDQKQQPIGYQGGIPQLVASREQMPYTSGAQNELLRIRQAAQDAMSTGATQDQVREAALRTYGISPTQFDQAMKTEGTYRRPGQGGITYFTPIQYTATGRDLGGFPSIQSPAGTTSPSVMPPGAKPGETITQRPSTVTAPTRFTDDQVAAAIRVSLQQGFDPQQTLDRAATLGATQDQLTRALAALKESGYGNLVMPGSTTQTGGLANVGEDIKRRAASASNVDMRALGESAVNAIRGGQSIESVVATAQQRLGIPESTVRAAIAQQGGVASALTARPSASASISAPSGSSTNSVEYQNRVRQIQDEYAKAGLPSNPNDWTNEHKQIAIDINNRVMQFNPYEKLIFVPETGGTTRAAPQVFSTLEPERKAAAESFLKAALPNAAELIRMVNTNGWTAAEKLIQDYRLSLDDMSKLMSPKDFATLKREIDVGNLRYKEPGRGSYYGAITTQTPMSSIGSGFAKTLERLSASDPKKADAFRRVMGNLNVYGQGIETHQAVPTFTLQDLGVPEYYHRGPIKLTYADVLAAETSNNPTEYYQQLARTRAASERSPFRTIKTSGEVDGIPIRVVPTVSGSYPTLGDMTISSPGDLNDAVNAYGLAPKDLDKLEDVLSGIKQERASNVVTKALDTNIINAVANAASSGYTKDQIYKGAKDNFGIPENRVEQALNSDAADRPIAMAVRDSLQAGFTMDQIYKGAQEKFGVSKDRVDEALRSMNMGGSDISGADVIRMSRERLKPPGAAAGGTMQGGIAMLAKGRYLKGNGDGVSDDIPAKFVGSGQPAALADGEFVIPARVVAEIGNGSSDAGARKLYAMLDRVEARARKAKRGKPSGADRELNKLA